MLKGYRFPSRLVRGFINARPNRFVMNVDVAKNGTTATEEVRCYCPVTGDIGYLNFDKSRIPCLLSKNMSKAAKTAYTVEAISLDAEKSWIGINQTRSNSYVEHFLKQLVENDDHCGDFLPVKKGGKVTREKTIGNARIDFCIQGDEWKHYIEVKTPMHSIPSEGTAFYDENKKKQASHVGTRLIKHFNALKTALEDGHTCAIVIFFMHPDADFKIPKIKDGAPVSKRMKEIREASNSARALGLTYWKMNVSVTPESVEFESLDPLG